MRTLLLLISLSVFLLGVSLIILSQQGYFNVNPWLVFKQTGNILSKHEPIKISIPSLNTTTTIERVGIDEFGKMDAPSNASIVSWYQFSATPGEKGNVVLSGHKDSTVGPGVFFTLRNIKDHATITLTRADGQDIIYKVSTVHQYTREQLPADEIFAGQKKDKLLYLVTCDGTSDFIQKTYDRRIVVIAKTE